MELYEAMMTAGAARQFRPDPIPDEVLYRVLNAARFAPSGGNRQGWRVLIVTDETRRRTLTELYQEPWREYLAQWYPVAPGAELPPKLKEKSDAIARLAEAPVHLLVCVKLDTLNITDAQLDRPSIIGGASIYPFVQNILLACHHEGLGAVLTTLLVAREPEVKQLLSIPDDYALAAFLPLGYPAAGGKPTKLKRRAVAEFAVRESFAGTAFAL